MTTLTNNSNLLTGLRHDAQDLTGLLLDSNRVVDAAVLDGLGPQGVEPVQSCAEPVDMVQVDHLDERVSLLRLRLCSGGSGNLILDRVVQQFSVILLDHRRSMNAP